MEVDTGVAVTLMSKTTHKQLEVKLKNSTVNLQTYTQESVSVLGTMEVEVRYGKAHPICYQEVWPISLWV